MTQNLTFLTPAFVLQVSDRRITKTDSGEINQLSNKNVVFLARDGLVSICYTGLAFLEGVPTDTWIACKLAGKDSGPYLPGDRQPVLVTSSPKRRWLKIAQAVELLRSELETVFSNLRTPSLMFHQIDVAGWREHKRGMGPISWRIENSWSRADRRTFIA